jgi:hypothetical protein
MEDQPNTQLQPIAPKKRRAPWLAVCIVVLVLIIGGVLLLIRHNSKPNMTPVAQSNSCISRQLSIGSSGNCVRDVQTMVNFLETDGLTECAFIGAQQLSVSGTFDAATQQQIKTVQTWINCYNKQEGNPLNTPANGTVGTATWSGICTYAYLYPKQSGQGPSPYLKASIAAGKDAGCGA